MISFIFLVIHLAILTTQISTDKRISILSPVFLFQVYFVIQLPLNHFLGVNFNLPRFLAVTYHFLPSDSLYLGGIILLSHVIFLISFYAISNIATSKRIKPAKWNRKYVNYISVAIILIGYLSFFGLMNYYGGFENFQITREAWRTLGISGMGWVVFPTTTGMSIAGCALVINNKNSFTGPGGIAKLLALYILVVAPATQLGFRSFVVLPALQFIFLYNFFVAKINIRWAAATGALIISIFTLYGMDRDMPYKETGLGPVAYVMEINEKRPELVLSVFLRSMGADVTQQTIDRMNSVTEYKEIYPIFIEALTIYVPAPLWPDKPKPLSVQFSTDIMDLPGGVSPTIVGEGYWHLGIIGVALLASFSGALNGTFERIKSLAATNDNSALMMVSIYPQLIMMAEAFQGYFNGLVLVAVFNFIFCRVVSLGHMGPGSEARR